VIKSIFIVKNPFRDNFFSTFSLDNFTVKPILMCRFSYSISCQYQLLNITSQMCTCLLTDVSQHKKLLKTQLDACPKKTWQETRTTLESQYLYDESGLRTKVPEDWIEQKTNPLYDVYANTCGVAACLYISST